MFGANGMSGELKRHEAALGRWCAALDPDALPLDDVAGVYEALARLEKLAAGARLRLAARVEACDVWRRSGHRHAADWLARTTGVTTGTAHAELAASTRLGNLPAVDDALRRGELSTVQAAVVADAAAVAPATVGRLVEQAARASVRELRDTCARVKASADPDADARYERIRRDRSVRTYTDAEGAWNLHARGPAHEGAAFQAALDAVTDLRFRQAYRDGEPEPRTAYAFDALVTLATHTGAASRNVKYRALLRVDVAALVRGYVDGEECCEVAGVGPYLSASLARFWATRSCTSSSRGVETLPPSSTSAGDPAPPNTSPCCGANPPAAAKAATRPGPTPKSTTASPGPKPTAPHSTASTASAATTTASKPTTAGPSSPAAANDPWCRPDTPTTRTIPTTQPGPHDHAIRLALLAHSAKSAHTGRID
jgi:hypothetical protein